MVLSPAFFPKGKRCGMVLKRATTFLAPYRHIAPDFQAQGFGLCRRQADMRKNADRFKAVALL
jgi:hypothetical protein